MFSWNHPHRLLCPSTAVHSTQHLKDPVRAALLYWTWNKPAAPAARQTATKRSLREEWSRWWERGNLKLSAQPDTLPLLKIPAFLSPHILLRQLFSTILKQLETQSVNFCRLTHTQMFSFSPVHRSSFSSNMLHILCQRTLTLSQIKCMFGNSRGIGKMTWKPSSFLHLRGVTGNN